MQWSKEKVRIIDKIDKKLHEMKKIDQYAPDYELTSIAIDQLNRKLNELKSEVHFL